MDEKTKIMISLGAATAANCIPCFEHLYVHAKSMEISDEVIKEIVDVSTKVKNGAHIAIKSAIQDIMGNGSETFGSNSQADRPCPCDCI